MAGRATLVEVVVAVRITEKKIGLVAQILFVNVTLETHGVLNPDLFKGVGIVSSHKS